MEQQTPIVEGMISPKQHLRFLILKNMEDMRKYELAGDVEKSFICLDWSFRWCAKVFDHKTLMSLEDDRKNLEAEIQKVSEQPNLNEISKNQKILALKRGFYRAHVVLSFYGVNLVGIDQHPMDSEIQFTETDAEIVKKIIRAGSGIPSVVKEHVDTQHVLP